MSSPEILKKFSKYGNDSGEHESDEVLEQYFCESEDVEDFYDDQERFVFVNARKGVGKSALLKHSRIKILKQSPESLTISLKGSDLSSPFASESEHAAVGINNWKKKICESINRELGRKIGFAITDDEIMLVENSEIDNYKDRNLVGALSERLRSKLFTIEKKNISIQNEAKLLERYSENKNIDVWLFIDDIDAKFKSEERYIEYITSFFSACRDLSHSVCGLKIRSTIRADVWPILRTHDESMDHCEQYMRKLRWDEHDIGNIIGKKIFAFSKNCDDFELPEKEEFYDSKTKQSQLLLARKYPWYGKRVPSIKPLVAHSHGRPRWSAKLLRESAKRAAKNNNENIKWADLSACFPEYSRKRYDELLAEHRHQFPHLERIYECFSHGPSIYSTSELLEKINSSYIERYGKPKLDGTNVESDDIAIAHFMFRSGFIVGRGKEDKSYYVEFEDRPTLLITEENLDDNLDWNIALVYRKTLSIGESNLTIQSTRTP